MRMTPAPESFRTPRPISPPGSAHPVRPRMPPRGGVVFVFFLLLLFGFGGFFGVLRVCFFIFFIFSLLNSGRFFGYVKFQF
jgi:hypothetical protein